VRYALGLMGDHLTTETLAKLATRMKYGAAVPLRSIALLLGDIKSKAVWKICTLA
jgi:hypothetical protein